MKALSFIFALFAACVISMACLSCSADESIRNITDSKTSVKNQKLQEETCEYAKLLDYMDEIAPMYNMTTESELSRGRWSRLWIAIRLDAMGYSWGVEHNLGWKVSLICAAVASVVGLVLGTKEAGITAWGINTDWQIYTPMREYEKMGYEHNRLVQQLLTKYPSIKSGNVPSSTILSNAETASSSLGYGATIPSMYRTQFLGMINTTSFSTLDARFLETMKDAQAMEVVNSYCQKIVQATDKTMAQTYTQTILSSIDQLNISNKDRLKAMICICENSRFLWKGVD